MTKWLDIARKYEGQAEVPGPHSNPAIMGLIKAAGGSWVADDSTTPWCGFFVGGVLVEAGMSEVLPREPGRARAWLDVGTRLDEPEEGCIAIFPRPPDPNSGHVTFVVEVDGNDLLCLGGNQHDAVSVSMLDKRKALGFVWPVALKSPRELHADGSRIMAAAARQQRDALVATSNGGSVPFTPPPPSSGAFHGVLESAGMFKGAAQTLIDFGLFAWKQWPWLAAAIALYFAVRILWDGHRIRLWRTEDYNKGYTTG